MTRALPFTEASLRRAITAARKAGLHVTGIRPDGTLIVIDGDNSTNEIVRLAPDGQPTAASKWEDVQA
jgi:hypothetical protein